MLTDIHWSIIPAAYCLDLVFGDPRFLPHPVVWMGNAIDFFEPLFRKAVKNPLASGLLFALFLILSTWVIAYGVIKAACFLHPVIGWVLQVILLFFCLSARSLETAAFTVQAALETGGLDKGREAVSMIVGRETAGLDETGVTKATVETVAENFVDGFLSPLFFALVGGVPLALAYKMVNTLDSMVGYRNETYLFFGRASARIDDAANYIPARLSVIMTALAAACFQAKLGSRALVQGAREGRLHKSPNAGFPEAAFSGALGVRLGGPNTYHGTLVEKPYIGKRFQDPDITAIRKACDLMLLASFISVPPAVGLIMLGLQDFGGCFI